MQAKHVLIVGTGSAGKRHAQNLAQLGCRISCVDPREDRCRELADLLDLAAAYPSLEAALAQRVPFDGVAVTSPPSVHAHQTLAAIEADFPVMLEKPVAPTREEGRRIAAGLSRSSRSLLLGYTYRWWPPLTRVKELIRQEVVGPLRHVKFVMGAHLADWHPWERYQDFFMASSLLGGGALLDESHWIDLMIWFFGMPLNLIARIEKISDLEIDTDDNVDMLLQYPDRLRVSMHLDLYERPHEKHIRFVGEKGTLLWRMDPNQVSVAHGWQDNWETETFTCERNDMFMGVAREFLQVMEGQPVQTCTLQDGLKVLDVVEAARRSSRTGQAVDLQGALGGV